MYLIEIQEHFNAAHAVQTPAGSWEQSHNHHWTLRIFFTRKRLNKFHMVVDFNLAKKVLTQVLEKLEGQNLNAIPAIGPSPTTELIARYIFDQTAAFLAETDVEVHSVALCEFDNAWAWYTPHPPAIS
jgi:6-pyruvoyl-tetrahydropterin synthase